MEALQKRETELKVQAQALEEVNVALRVLLKRRENDQREMEEKVLANVKELVFPFIQQLKKTKLDAKQLGYLNIVQSNLDEIISPFSSKLSGKYLSLTPKEIRVANLIKAGKSSKDISELLNGSVRAVDFHRGNLREK